jgi:peptidoglycan-associated lipoprotein
MQHVALRRFTWMIGLAAVLMAFAGCKKKVASTPPASAPATTPQPTVTLNASPASVNPGDTVTLSWSSTNATDLDIEPSVGKVALQGTTPVNPTQSTTYTITATGAGGSATATASVNVASAQQAAPQAPAGQPSLSELFDQNVKDVYFELDKSDLANDARAALTKDAEFLRTYSQVHVSIEGHCDERGSTEYNLGLGQRRAEAAKNYLISLGISPDRMETTSWGKERPFCTEHDESCWQQNRRAHFVLSK